MSPRFFKSADALRAWLEKNHARAKELLVGFYNRRSGRTGLTYKQAVDQALCFGWIDGVRHSVDEGRYSVRFTPRKPKSYWSRVNVSRAGELRSLGLMRPPGLRVFEARDELASARYSFERESSAFDAAAERTFKGHARAWAFFQSRPPWYRRTVTFWVMSAKKEETRRRRLTVLIGHCAAGAPIPALDRRPAAAKKPRPA
ncbi:MAG TPA: YdeI/OmpD-associated family protein [Vicinamibacteria bacterium]|nr:YdeI/OmpD-associated family protein [Vicinamibacteria bacterium]